MKYRKLRIAWSVAWGVVAALLCVLWASTYERPYGYDGDEFGLLSIRGHASVELDEDAVLNLYIQESARHNLSGENGPSFYIEGNYARAPVWSLVILSIALAAAPWLPYRFSLRSLLIATTLAAVVLGIIVYALH